jgi:hypothetical protein
MITMFKNSFVYPGALLRKKPKVNVLLCHRKEYLSAGVTSI